MCSHFLFNSTAETSEKAVESALKKLEPTAEPTAKRLKSERYLECDDAETDLQVPKTMQDFVYKKMSKKIDESIEFVTVDKRTKRKQKEEKCDIGVRLLSDTELITEIDILETKIEIVKRAKPKIQRRIIEEDNETEKEKLRLTAIDGQSILKQTEIKHWKPRKIRPNKLFMYREKNAKLFLIEPENEFSKLRKKNNWSENKISTFHRKTK